MNLTGTDGWKLTIDEKNTFIHPIRSDETSLNSKVVSSNHTYTSFSVEDTTITLSPTGCW